MTETSGGEMLLTIFLKHRQSMNLGENNQKLEAAGFWKKFPPEGTEVLSWYVLGRLRGRVLRDLRFRADPRGSARAGAGRLAERTRRLTRSAKKGPAGAGREWSLGSRGATARGAVRFHPAPEARGSL
jgi:hypothetical protein